MRPIAGGFFHNEYGGTPVKITPGTLRINKGKRCPKTSGGMATFI
ncbi:MAG: hypothetical protein O4861_12205 [Trichodesmium sp. St16_bin4-tuft]|nr:hypothetical protein [Trichodesmium sp. St18_bin3_1_1]MDE5099051.1 hypothetical protein [Trichodesmium sp. St16_bin4-tuft]MDE5102361.1 hypothetical protein [Trichodesmium sp. St19_bin2]MDT9339487.1 hypothetical protein [Trichodesmium erythraeum 21-75]